MQPASPVESCLFSPIFPVFHDKILHSLSFPLTAHGDARSSEELNQNMRLLTQARSHFVRFCNISLIRISQGTTPHCPPLCSHQTGPGPPVRDVITTRLSSDDHPLASLRTRLAVDAYFSRLCISPWLCLHPPALTCSCKCAGLAGPGCVWKCQKFDGLGANEAKLGWSLCMLSTMLTRVLTPDLVTTMSELKLLLLCETHYTFRLLVINMLGTMA